LRAPHRHDPDALPYNEGTTIPETFARGYMSPACVAELVRDGAEPGPADTDTTNWNASYGQIDKRIGAPSVGRQHPDRCCRRP
jgi:hypothetical protein